MIVINLNYIVLVKCISSCSAASIRMAETQTDAEELLKRIGTRLQSSDPTRLFIIATPLLIDLLKGVAFLCNEFRPLLANGLQIIKDFLVNPAMCLIKLSKLQSRKDSVQNKNIF